MEEQEQQDTRKPYTPPAEIVDLELEVRAGSGGGCLPDEDFDLLHPC